MEVNRSEQELVRFGKLDSIREVCNPYPERFEVTHKLKDAKNLEDGVENVSLAGRITFMRKMGKLSFVRIQDLEGSMQLEIKIDIVGEEKYQFFKKQIDSGDFIGASGEIFTTQTGEKTLRVQELTFLGKALRPMPEKFHGVADTEIKYRQRYVDLIANEETRRVFLGRSKFYQFLHRFLGCTIKTVLIINEAYALYGKDHPINKNSKLNRLLNRMNEMYIPNLDEEAQIQSVDSSDKFILGNIIGRILGIKRSAINCINININSILVDEDGIWIEKIKSLINFNSYDSNDLKRLYEVLDHYNKSYQIPNEFELDDAKYFKNGNGTYLKEKIRKKHENAFYPYCPYFSYCDSYENKRPELEFISESEFRDAYIYRYKRFPKNYNKTLLVF